MIRIVNILRLVLIHLSLFGDSNVANPFVYDEICDIFTLVRSNVFRLSRKLTKFLHWLHFHRVYKNILPSAIPTSHIECPKFYGILKNGNMHLYLPIQATKWDFIVCTSFSDEKFDKWSKNHTLSCSACLTQLYVLNLIQDVQEGNLGTFKAREYGTWNEFHRWYSLISYLHQILFWSWNSFTTFIVEMRSNHEVRQIFIRQMFGI